MDNKSSNTRLSFLKGFVGFSLSSWVNAGLSLISTPVITRVFSTGELGKIQLFISIVNMLLNFAYLGVDQAFTRFYYEPPGKNDKKSFMTVCMTITGIFVLFISAGIIFARKWISATVLGYVSFIIPVSVIVAVISQVITRFFNLAARMEKNILLFNIQAITTTVISNMSYVAVALYTPTAENAIIFRTLLMLIAATVFVLIAVKKSMSFKMDLSKGVVKNILLYSLPVCPASILSIANSSIGQILMKHYVSYSAVGIYSNAVTVAGIITIIQNGLNSYWGPFVYENYKTKQNQIIKMHHIISFIIITFGLLVIFFQDLIYLLLIGKSFWASKQLFPLLIISPISYTISETLGMGIRLSQRTYLNIPVYIVNLIVNVGLCFILLPRIGVIGAAIATAVSSICMLVLKSIFGEKTYRCSDNYLRLIIAMTALIAAAVIHIFVYTSPVKYIVYIITLLIIMLAYMPQIKEIMYLLGDIFKRLSPKPKNK